MKNKNIILPHEIIFGAFLIFTWILLACKTGITGFYTDFYSLYLLVNFFLIFLNMKLENNYTWRLRLIFYPIMMNVIFQQMRFSVPIINPIHKDLLLQHIDGLIIGNNLSVLMQSVVSPVLTEIMSFCYVIFMPYLFFSMIWYFVGNIDLCKKFYIGLFSIYGLGFIGYTLLPALGPYLAMKDQFDVPIIGGIIFKLCSKMVSEGSNHVDVFPSLHCAVSSYLLFFDRKYKPWRFWFYLLPCVGLWISTIYLRYHYFIDLIFGFLLSALCLYIAFNYKIDKEKGKGTT